MGRAFLSTQNEAFMGGVSCAKNGDMNRQLPFFRAHGRRKYRRESQNKPVMLSLS
jgi:hypothetical protein